MAGPSDRANAAPAAKPPVGLIEALRHHAKTGPDRQALCFPPTSYVPERCEISYGMLLDRAAQVGRFLSRRVAPGSRALLIFPTVPEFAFAFLGCLMAGVVAVPLPMPFGRAAQSRVRNVWRDCGPDLVLSTSAVIDDLASATEDATGITADRWIAVDALGACEPVAEVGPPREAELAFLQYTSGTTAEPKGVMIPPGAIAANARAIEAAFGIEPSSTILSWLPLHHDLGLLGGLVQPIFSGARGVLLDPSAFMRRPLRWLEEVSREKAEISGAPNFAYDLCTRLAREQSLSGLDLSHWRIAFNGAAPVHPETQRRFSERFGPAGFAAAAHTPCYGLAEATLLVASAPRGSFSVDRFDTASLETGVAAAAQGDAAAGRELIGYPLPSHADLAIVAPGTAEPVAEGKIGEVAVAAQGNGVGYWGKPEASAATFGLSLPGGAGLYLRTGDLGFIAGGRLYLAGRQKDLIVHRGRNIHPGDLEAGLDRIHGALRPDRCAIFGVDSGSDEEIVLCHEVRRGTDRATLITIAGALRRHIALRHGLGLRTVLLVPAGSLPFTTSGKIQRAQVAERYRRGRLAPLFEETSHHDGDAGPGLAERLSGFASAEEISPEALAGALCDLLEVRLDLPTRPDPQVAPAALGAESLTLMGLLHEIERTLGVVLPAASAFRAGSIAELAAEACAAAAQRTAASPTASAPPGAPGYALNTAQKSLWLVQKLRPDRSDYNIARLFRIEGECGAGRIEATLRALAARHPSLRLSIRENAGAPEATIADAAPLELERIEASGWETTDLTRWFRAFAARPFDLAAGPVLRAAFLARGNHAMLALSVHHIACDGHSFVQLVQEIFENSAAGPAPVSPGAFEAASLDGRRRRLESFWTAELTGEIPRLVLDHAAAEGAPVEAFEFEFDGPGAARLGATARRLGLTRQTLLLSLWQVLLHRFSGQADLVVGVPTLGRQRPGLQGRIGYFANVLPIRSRYRAGMPLSGFAEATGRRLWDALDHQDLPYAEIVRALNPDRDGPEGALFQAMFAHYEAVPGADGQWSAMVLGGHKAGVTAGKTRVSLVPMPDDTTQAEICLNAFADGDSLRFSLQYEADKLRRNVAEQLVRAFRVLLAAAGAADDTPVSRLALLSPKDARALVAAGTGPSRLRAAHYLDTFEQIVATFPDRIAVEDETKRITYRELDQSANALARTLQRAGVGLEGCVIVSAERSAAYAAVLLAIHKAGGCYVPVSPGEAPKRVNRMIEAVRPAVVIADDAGRGLLAGLLPNDVLCLDMANAVSGRDPVAPERQTPSLGGSYVIHTSGSTGQPKPVVSTNAGLTNHLWQMIEYFDLGPDDCVGQTGPVTFDVSVWQYIAPLLVGGRARVVPDSVTGSASGVLAATVAGGVTLLELIPSMVNALLDAGLAVASHRLRHMIATGEALSPDIPRRWQSEMPAVPLYNAYGPCECTDDVSIGFSARPGRADTSNSIGHPLTNTAMLILDDYAAPQPTGVVGWLCVGGAGVGRGYLGDPRKTAAAFLPDPWSRTPGATLYRTGDLGRMTADGAVDFMGRADTQIKIRGLRIEPGDVEAALRSCGLVQDAAVIVTEGATGRLLVGFVVLHEASGAAALGVAEEDAIRAELRTVLPRHMIPSALVKSDRLPRTSNGKTDYKALSFVLPATGETRLEDDDDIARAIRAAWCKSLSRQEIAAEDNFFQLGGHSLLAFTMIAEIVAQTGREVRIDTIFAAPRFADFVAAVRAAGPAMPGKTVTVATGAPIPAAAAQTRFWFLQERAPDLPGLNMPGALRLTGPLDPAALASAFTDVQVAHPVLCARFDDAGGRLTWRPGSPQELNRLDLQGPMAEIGAPALHRLLELEARTPFALRSEPPLRALLVQLARDDWCLLVTIHHIACDAWSLDILLRELSACYTARMNGHRAPIPHDPQGFAQHCLAETVRPETAIETRLASELKAALLVPLRLFPAHTGEGADTAGFVLSSAASERIATLAQDRATTPFVILASAVAALMAEPGQGRETVVLGTLVADRQRPEVQDLIGPFLNIGVLPVDVGAEDTLGRVIGRARQSVERASRLSGLSFQRLLEAIGPVETADGVPFEVLLVLQPDVTDTYRFEGLTTDVIETDPGHAPHRLLIDVSRTDGRYRFAFRHRDDHETRAILGRFAARLAAAFEAEEFSAAADVRSLRRWAGLRVSERSMT